MRARSSRVHLALVLPFLVAACASETVAQPPPPPVNWHSLQPRPVVDAGKTKATDKERAVAATYTLALASAGFVALGTAIDEEAHFAFASTKERDAHGRERVVKAHDALFGAFDERAFVVNRIWLTDSSHAIEWTMTGVHTREWMGIKAARKPVSIKGLTLLWTKDDGSISDIHVYFDETVVKAQLGARPKDPVGRPPPPQAPAGGSTAYEQAGSPEEDANVALVRASLEGLEKNDEPAYAAPFADDVMVSTLEQAEASHGKAGAAAYFNAMRRAIGQLDVSIETAWGIQDFVIVEYSIGGRQTAPIGRIPLQRDTILKMSATDVVQMRDGKIARVWRYDNP
jgi:ketosteroid isomerase-like protein